MVQSEIERVFYSRTYLPCSRRSCIFPVYANSAQSLQIRRPRNASGRGWVVGLAKRLTPDGDHECRRRPETAGNRRGRGRGPESGPGRGGVRAGKKAGGWAPDARGPRPVLEKLDQGRVPEQGSPRGVRTGRRRE